jgi:hypothetical protein
MKKLLVLGIFALLVVGAVVATQGLKINAENRGRTRRNHS